jgi:hypothetical protein
LKAFKWKIRIYIHMYFVSISTYSTLKSTIFCT